MTSPTLLYETRDRIATLTLNRPNQRNALNGELLTQLIESVKAARDDDDVRAVVLTGAGDKAFAAGTDIAQFQEFKGAEDGIAYERKIDGILNAVERCAPETASARRRPALIIGAVEVPANIAATSPATVAVVAGAPPR